MLPPPHCWFVLPSIAFHAGPFSQTDDWVAVTPSILARLTASCLSHSGPYHPWSQTQAWFDGGRIDVSPRYRAEQIPCSPHLAIEQISIVQFAPVKPALQRHPNSQWQYELAELHSGEHFSGQEVAEMVPSFLVSAVAMQSTGSILGGGFELTHAPWLPQAWWSGAPPMNLRLCWELITPLFSHTLPTTCKLTNSSAQRLPITASLNSITQSDGMSVALPLSSDRR